MKKYIINKCMNYIKKYNNYSDTKLKEIEYGLIGIYLTISKLVIIFAISLLLGIFKEMLIFLLLFNVLRSTGFGIHATKSWICLICSTSIFLIIPYLSINIIINLYIKILICIFCIITIYKYAPADTHKRPIVNKKRRNIYKFLTCLFSIIYSFLSIYITNQFLSNCLIFSMITECLMIAPITYKIFKLPYNNYIEFLKTHPSFNS